MNDKISLSNRVVVFGCAVVLFAMVLLFGLWNQPSSFLVEQENSSVSPYTDVELLAGPEVGHGSGGG